MSKEIVVLGVPLLVLVIYFIKWAFKKRRVKKYSPLIDPMKVEDSLTYIKKMRKKKAEPKKMNKSLIFLLIGLGVYVSLTSYFLYRTDARTVTLQRTVEAQIMKAPQLLSNEPVAKGDVKRLAAPVPTSKKYDIDYIVDMITKILGPISTILGILLASKELFKKKES